ncbi:LPS translocon maturation chaperone LptM [Aliidiomarina sp. Khilg15.8]
MPKRIIGLISSILFVLLLTACGQKGPLYLPPEAETTERPDERTQTEEVVDDNV